MKICWCTIHVNDMEQSKNFYGDVLGLKMERTFSPAPGHTIAFFNGDDEGAKIELISGDDIQSDEEKISIGFMVNNLESMIQKLKSNNVKILRGPLTLGKDTYCVFVKDPNGIEIQLVENNES